MRMQIDSEKYEELWQRIQMLSDIALSAIALKLNIEHGLPPNVHALDRDLAAYQARFVGIISTAWQGGVVANEPRSQ